MHRIIHAGRKNFQLRGRRFAFALQSGIALGGLLILGRLLSSTLFGFTASFSATGIGMLLLLSSGIALGLLVLHSHPESSWPKFLALWTIGIASTLWFGGLTGERIERAVLLTVGALVIWALLERQRDRATSDEE